MKVFIESSVALEQKHRKDIETKLSSTSGETLEFEYKTDPSLLGGLRIVTPTKVVDMSLAAKLNQLNSSLLSEE